MQIANWVRREGIESRVPGSDRHKWHLVESVVADAAITRCGRRMEPKDARGRALEVAELEPLTRLIGQPQNCQACSR